MKRLLISLAVLLLVAAIGLKAYADIRHNQQMAILSVFNQANAACTQTRTYPNGRKIIVHAGDRMFSVRAYTTVIDRIATVQCPNQFSVAWLQYVQALERNQEPFSGLGAVGEYAVSVVKPSGAVTQDALARLDRINAPEAWRHVVMVALQYGVQIHDR